MLYIKFRDLTRKNLEKIYVPNHNKNIFLYSPVARVNISNSIAAKTVSERNWLLAEGKWLKGCYLFFQVEIWIKPKQKPLIQIMMMITAELKTPESVFLIFQKEMTEKLVEMAGVRLSNTEMLGMVAERWKTLDQYLKMEYEKRVSLGKRHCRVNTSCAALCLCRQSAV
jgi:hypothetical protein